MLTLLRCFAHVVNLSCKAMLDEAKESGFTQVDKLHNIVVYVSFKFFFFLSLYCNRFATPH